MSADIVSFPGSPAMASGQRCPICGRPTHAGTRPFCSRRCADLDLKRWLDGSYRIPGQDDQLDSDRTEAEPD